MKSGRTDDAEYRRLRTMDAARRVSEFKCDCGCRLAQSVLAMDGTTAHNVQPVRYPCNARGVTSLTLTPTLVKDATASGAYPHADPKVATLQDALRNFGWMLNGVYLDSHDEVVDEARLKEELGGCVERMYGPKASKEAQSVQAFLRQLTGSKADMLAKRWGWEPAEQPSS